MLSDFANFWHTHTPNNLKQTHFTQLTTSRFIRACSILKSLAKIFTAYGPRSNKKSSHKTSICHIR